MTNKSIFLAIFSMLIFAGIANAGSVSIFNSSLSTLNATYITPNSTYEYLNTTYSVNTSSNATLTNVTWIFNGTVINQTNLYSQNLTNATINTTFNYNFTGNVTLTVIINDTLNNSVNSTQNITFNQYILPSISKISPTNSTVNVSQIWSATATAGTFAVSNITWEFDNNYLTDMAFNGVNYQTYMFNQSGYFSTIAQICDINGFCSESTTSLYIASTVPLSYWEVSNASLTINLNPPNAELMTLTWIPQNDTNAISTVSINWGDQSPIQIFNFPSGTTQYSFQHDYTVINQNYNITVTNCDTIGNCYEQFIATVYYQQTIVGSVSQLLFNTNPNTNVSSIFGNFLNAIGLSIGTALGDMLFFILIIILSVIVIIIAGLTFYKIFIQK